MVSKQKFIDVCWGCCWGYKLSWQLLSLTSKLYNCSGWKVFGCLDTELGKILFHCVLFCDKENRDIWSEIYFFFFGKISRFAGPWNIFVSLLVPVNKKFIGPNLRWRKKTQKSKKTMLVTPNFLAFNWSAGQFSQIVKFLGDFTIENWKKSKAKPNYCWRTPTFMKP